MAEFEVDVRALEAFAQTSDRRRASFGDERASIDAIRLDGEAFGRIPGIGPRIHAAYSEHVQACADGVASAAEAMAAIASGVRAVALNYELADGDATESLATINRQLDGVTIRGAR